jgi:hypothetical protein
VERPEYIQELLLESRSLKHPDDIVGVRDWEKTMADDVNYELQSQK